MRPSEPLPSRGGAPLPLSRARAVPAALVLLAFVVAAQSLSVRQQGTTLRPGVALSRWQPTTTNLRSLLATVTRGAASPSSYVSEEDADACFAAAHGPSVLVPTTFDAPSAGLPARDGGVLSAGYFATTVIAADAFLVGDCIRVLSATDCELPVDHTQLEIAVAAGYLDADCGGSGRCSEDDSLLRLPRGPPSRLKLRSDWEWTVEAELCMPQLARLGRVDATLHLGPASKAVTLVRVDAPAVGTAAAVNATTALAEVTGGEPVAMMSLFHAGGGAIAAPLWVDAWAALGVGRFYLYYNGRLPELQRAQPELFARLVADTHVTLVQWPFAMWQRGAYLEHAPGTCTGHFAQMMAFNAAYHRFGHRHAYMGFFDLDELPVASEGAFAAAAADGDRGGNVLLHAMRALGSPPVASLASRWAAVWPPFGATCVGPVSVAHALAGHAFYGAELLPGRARSKYFVRCPGSGGSGGLDPASLLGNHAVFTLTDVEATGPTAVLRGSGYETRGADGSSGARGPLLDAGTAHFLHVLNVGDGHQSMQADDVGARVQRMVADARNRVDAAVRPVLRRVLELSGQQQQQQQGLVAAEPPPGHPGAGAAAAAHAGAPFAHVAPGGRGDSGTPDTTTGNHGGADDPFR